MADGLMFGKLGGLHMIGDYFGSALSGCLPTKRFIVLWLALMLAFVALGLLIGVSIGVAERLIGGDLATAQKLLIEKLGLPAIIGVFVIFILFAFAKLNIIAKRARDIGLPGWLTAIVFAGLIGSSTQAVGQASAGGIGLLLLIVLAFVPTHAMARTTK